MCCYPKPSCGFETILTKLFLLLWFSNNIFCFCAFCFKPHSRISLFCKDVAIADEGLHKSMLGIYSHLIVTNLLWHGTSLFAAGRPFCRLSRKLIFRISRDIADTYSNSWPRHNTTFLEVFKTTLLILKTLFCFVRYKKGRAYFFNTYMWLSFYWYYTFGISILLLFRAGAGDLEQLFLPWPVFPIYVFTHLRALFELFFIDLKYQNGMISFFYMLHVLFGFSYCELSHMNYGYINIDKDSPVILRCYV